MQKGTEFVWVGGQLALDLVNTEVIREGQRVDLLQSTRDLARWLEEAAARYPDADKGMKGRVDTAILTAVRQLRAGIREMADTMVVAKPVPAGVVETLNRTLARAGRIAQLESKHGHFALDWRYIADGRTALLAPVAEAAAWLLTEGDPARVHKCGNPDCILYMYDTTKSRTRQWCDMKTCGNRMKAAKYYQRHRAARGR